MIYYVWVGVNNSCHIKGSGWVGKAHDTQNEGGSQHYILNRIREKELSRSDVIGLSRGEKVQGGRQKGLFIAALLQK